MDKIAFYSGGTAIYWNSVVLTLAAATAICFFLAFYLGKSGNGAAGFAVVPVSMVLSLVLSRFFHWYCQSDSSSCSRLTRLIVYMAMRKAGLPSSPVMTWFLK